MSVGTLLVRADASVAMGTGHVMRCLALAQAWQEVGGRAVFVMVEATAAIQERLTGESCEVRSISCAAGSLEDAEETVALARQQQTEWIAVDGCQFAAEYQQTLKRAGFKLLVIDDGAHAQRYFADVILDQNINAPKALYRERAGDAILLLGAKYVLLRREFASRRDWRRPVDAVGSRLLISMGGSDPDNLTADALDAVDRAAIAELETTVVIGGHNPDARMLEARVERSGSRFRLLRDTSQMPDLFAAADIAMIAAGGTLWEALFMQCAVFSYARDGVQQAVVEALAEQEAVVLATGESESASQTLRRLVYSREWRESLSRKGGELIDGLGAKRVVGALLGRGNTA